MTITDAVTCTGRLRRAGWLVTSAHATAPAVHLVMHPVVGRVEPTPGAAAPAQRLENARSSG